MDIHVSEHAVDQYRERVVPHLSTPAARDRLLELMVTARKTNIVSRQGAELWLVGEDVRIMVNYHAATHSRYVVTVLGNDGCFDAWSAKRKKRVFFR